MRVGLKESNFIETSPRGWFRHPTAASARQDNCRKAANLPLTNSWRRLSFFRQ